jgi:hypothetical protein
MDIAARWSADPDAEYARLDAIRSDSLQAERSLREKYGVKKTADLEDEDLTDAERHFLFYEKSPSSREQIDEITRQLQPVDSLDEAAREISYALRDIPTDPAKMNNTQQLAVMRLQVLFSEVERMGGDVNEIIKSAGKKYAARFSDPEDALFMAQNAADDLRKLFAHTDEPAVVETRALPAPDVPQAKVDALAVDPKTDEAVLRNLDRIRVENPDAQFTTQVRQPDGSFQLVSRPLEDVMDELDSMETLGKELEACAIGMEAAE